MEYTDTPGKFKWTLNLTKKNLASEYIPQNSLVIACNWLSGPGRNDGHTVTPVFTLVYNIANVSLLANNLNKVGDS